MVGRVASPLSCITVIFVIARTIIFAIIVVYKGDRMNLKNYININDNANVEIQNSFEKLYCNGMSDVEKDTVLSFSREFVKKSSVSQHLGYWCNQKVDNGISEEFDLIRFSDNTILNIELKSTIAGKELEEIKDQLLRHKFLLKQLNKELILATYIGDENKIYYLDDIDLKEVTFDYLVNLIEEDYLEENELEKLNYSNYIVSPYSEPEKFKNHEYFLNSDQMKIRKAILNSKNRYSAIIGGPGTGKSILLLDIAQKYKSYGKNVVLVFCGILNEKEKISKELGIKCIEAKELPYFDVESYDVLLVDEIQRIRVEQYNDLIKKKVEKIILSVDHSQTLHPTEENVNIENVIENDKNIEHFNLKYKVRTNPEMSAFIKKFMNLKVRNVEKQPFKNVKAIYFESRTEAKEYIEHKHNEKGYIPIELTEYTTKIMYVKKRPNIYRGSKSVHEVVGREFDNIIVVIDELFYYNSDALLRSKSVSHYPFIEHKCIFEALTRVKNKLEIVFVANENLYTTTQEILTWYSDKKEVSNAEDKN